MGGGYGCLGSQPGSIIQGEGHHRGSCTCHLGGHLWQAGLLPLTCAKVWQVGEQLAYVLHNVLIPYAPEAGEPAKGTDLGPTGSRFVSRLILPSGK